MDYYVQPIPERVEMQASGEFSAKNEFELVPLGPGDDRNAAQVLVEEYNPQEILIPVLTLPKTEKSAKPFFLYGNLCIKLNSNDARVYHQDELGDIITVDPYYAVGVVGDFHISYSVAMRDV